MQQFNSFAKFAKHIEKVSKQYDEKEHKALEYLGEYLEQQAKNTIGHLQTGGGEFADWKPLAATTIAEKKRLGYAYNSEFNPLLREGDLRESIHHMVVLHSLFVGSASDIMVYQEMGTKNIPPRSVLGLTMFKEKYMIVLVLAKFIEFWITAATKSFLSIAPIRISPRD